MPRHETPTRVFDGTRLRMARTNLGISRINLCRKVDFIVSERCIYHYEKGRTVPNVNAAAWIADVLKIPLDALFVRGRSDA